MPPLALRPTLLGSKKKERMVAPYAPCFALLDFKKKDGMVTPPKLPLITRTAQEYDPSLAFTLPCTMLAKMTLVLVVTMPDFKKMEGMVVPSKLPLVSIFCMCLTYSTPPLYNSE